MDSAERRNGIPTEVSVMMALSSSSSSEKVENSPSVIKDELGLRRLVRALTLPAVVMEGACMRPRPSAARKTLDKSSTAKTVVGE